MKASAHQPIARMYELVAVALTHCTIGPEACERPEPTESGPSRPAGRSVASAPFAVIHAETELIKVEPDSQLGVPEGDSGQDVLISLVVYDELRIGD